MWRGSGFYRPGNFQSGIYYSAARNCRGLESHVFIWGTNVIYSDLQNSKSLRLKQLNHLPEPTEVTLSWHELCIPRQNSRHTTGKVTLRGSKWLLDTHCTLLVLFGISCHRRLLLTHEAKQHSELSGIYRSESWWILYFLFLNTVWKHYVSYCLNNLIRDPQRWQVGVSYIKEVIAPLCPKKNLARARVHWYSCAICKGCLEIRGYIRYIRGPADGLRWLLCVMSQWPWWNEG